MALNKVQTGPNHPIKISIATSIKIFITETEFQEELGKAISRKCSVVVPIYYYTAVLMYILIRQLHERGADKVP